MALIARRALLTDRTAMRNLLTTVVNGQSPLQELRADYGAGALNFTAAQLQQCIQSGAFEVLVCHDGAPMRGWSIFAHQNGIEHIAADAWQHAYTVTDKSLTLVNRLNVVREIVRTACGVVDPSVHVWADVKTPGNLDTFLQGLNPNFPAFTGFPFFPVTSYGVSCNRFYESAANIVARF